MGPQCTGLADYTNPRLDFISVKAFTHLYAAIESLLFRMHYYPSRQTKANLEFHSRIPHFTVSHSYIINSIDGSVKE